MSADTSESLQSSMTMWSGEESCNDDERLTSMRGMFSCCPYEDLIFRIVEYMAVT